MKSIRCQSVYYCVETDTLAIEVRRWPGRDDEHSIGREAGNDLMTHCAPDGARWLWEIDHASGHPKHIAAALAELRRPSVASV